MQVAFMGTAAFAVPSLTKLVNAGYDVTAVFTQPDRASGRGQKVVFSPIKETALSLDLALHQPESLKSDTTRGLMEAVSPDLIVVVSYGKILPPWLVHFPSLGIVNLHGSLLPKYRGAAPINWAIANGESETGVCTMQIDEGMDTGPVYLCQGTPIEPDETAPELSERLAALGATLLTRTLARIERGQIQPTPQDDHQATMAPPLRKQDGFIQWSESARSIHNKVRAFLPWPSVVVGFRGHICKILRSRCIQFARDEGGPGTIAYESNRLIVRCGDGRWLQIEKLQLENKNVVSAGDFANGVHLVSGERFTSHRGPDRTPGIID
jgi:methionyl-tRNA formyltransferase